MMTWGGWENFWAMGGYAPYVWGAYGVTLLILLLELMVVRARRRRALAEIERVCRLGEQ
ncbi:MAG: heme exporter protein CcmD [Chromatiales bacterium]